MTFDKSQPVSEIAVENPAAVRVFDKFGIDYCCGGKRSLQEACENANAPIDRVVQALRELQANNMRHEERQWTTSALAELTAHIVDRHHRYIRDEVPRIEGLLQKVVDRHGKAHPELMRIQETFRALSGELLAHMMKEERILFPFLEEMETGARVERAAPLPCFASIELPISRMLADHNDAGVLTARMRELSGGYRAPEESCPSYRGLYQALEEFERDLHQHIHLENNILFPRAVEMERTQEENAHVAR
ncbi:MAG TPA: iron-sulfur cluster repair di-iron protein [Bryobacteraceae bacterium]